MIEAGKYSSHGESGKRHQRETAHHSAFSNPGGSNQEQGWSRASVTSWEKEIETGHPGSSQNEARASSQVCDERWSGS